MKTTSLLALLLTLALAGPAFAQQRRFDWIPANDETARLDPANYYGGRTYNPSPGGGNLHVDIKAQQPVTIFMARAADWSYALQHPEAMATLSQVCARTHVTESTYTCFIPEPMTLVIEDERQSTSKAVFAGLGAALNTTQVANTNPGRVASAGLAALLSGGSPAKKHFTDPSDVHVQYYRWNCVENCVQPEFAWIRSIKEKYKLTPLLKIYGGYAPDRDGEQVSIRIKSPVPMVVAMLPSSIADQIYAKPEMFDAALEKNACQQRGVQSLQFQCTFNAADGPQSLVLGPESTAKVPRKNAEVEMLAFKCTENCNVLPPPNSANQ